MPFPNDRRWSFDINLQVGDGVAPMTATGFAQNGGANGIIDLGGNQGANPKQQARMDAVMVVDISAMVAAGTYSFDVIGSNDPAMGAGNVVLGSVRSGTLSIPNPQAPTAPPGTIEILFTNNQMGLIYEYVALLVTVGGTGPSTQFHAFVAVLPVI